MFSDRVQACVCTIKRLVFVTETLCVFCVVEPDVTDREYEASEYEGSKMWKSEQD